MPPRIAHVVSTRGVGGAERFLADLIAASHEHGWQQLLLNPFSDRSSLQLSEFFYPARYVGYPCGNLAALPFLRHKASKELTRFKPDLVHVLLFHALVTVATVPRSSEVRILTHMYGEGICQGTNSLVRERLDRWAGQRFDHVVAISESVQRFLISGHGYSPSRVSCIPPGWEGEPLAAKPDDRAPTVVCVAKYRPEKGHSVLLDAFVAVRREVPNARLVLVGGGALQDELMAMAATKGLGDSVEFPGEVCDAWPYLADAHVFALASRAEAFGIAVVEAMAAGLPVVASAVGGIPELVVPGVTGELFPAGDHEALARQLVLLLRSPELRARLGAAGRAAAEPLRRRNTVPRYIDLFQQLLDQRQRKQQTDSRT